MHISFKYVLLKPILVLIKPRKLSPMFLFILKKKQKACLYIF
ncbi:conserved hypothetical protein (plasmid) [Borreliella burgdorferi 29805]|nr:conserved hypothetical protein [Borreliella burgdorferi 29805]